MANYNNSAEMMDEASVDNSTGVASTKKLTKAQKQAMDQAAWRQADSQSAFGEAAYNRAQEGAQDVIGSVVQQSNYKGGDEDYLNDIAGIGSMNSEQLDEAVAQKQEALAKLGNATLNNLTLAGTTAAMGTIGFIDGLLETVFGLGADAYAAATGQYKEGDLAKSFGHMWDNATNRALTDVQTAAQEHFNIYKSKEWQDSSLGSKMGTANFWADLWQNMGFTEGMALQAALTMGLGSAAAANNMAKVSSWIYKMNHPLMSAIGEAATEAIQNKNEYVKEKELKLTQEYNRQMEQFGDNNETLGVEAQKNFQRKMEEVQNDAIAQGNFIGLTNVALLSITNRIEFGSLFSKGYDSSRRMALNFNEQAAKNAIKNGKAAGSDITKALNSIGKSENDLTVKNIKETTKFINSEEESIKKSIKSLKKDMNKETDPIKKNEIQSKIDGLVERQNNLDVVKNEISLKNKVGASDPFSVSEEKWKTIAKATLRGLGNNVTEGFEETSQNWMRSFTGNNVAWDQFKNSDWNNFQKAEFNNDWGNQLSGILTSIVNTELWNKDIAYEAMMGFLTGALGVPGLKAGKPGWSGGMIEPINEALDARRKAIATAQTLNERLYNNKEFQAFTKGFIRHQAYEDLKTAAAQVNDRKSWNDAKFKQTMSDVIMFDEAGHLDKLSGLYKTALEELTDEDVAQMIEDTTKTNDKGEKVGPWINEAGEVMTPEEVKEVIQKKSDDINKVIDRYKAVLDHTNKNFEFLNDDSRHALAYTDVAIQDLTDRISSLFDEFSHGEFKSLVNKASEDIDAINYGAEVYSAPEESKANEFGYLFLKEIVSAAEKAKSDKSAVFDPFDSIANVAKVLAVKRIEDEGISDQKEKEKVFEEEIQNILNIVKGQIDGLVNFAKKGAPKYGSIFSVSEDGVVTDAERMASDVSDYISLCLDLSNLNKQQKDIINNPVEANKSKENREAEAIAESEEEEKKAEKKKVKDDLKKKIEKLNNAYETNVGIIEAWAGIPINSSIEDQIFVDKDTSDAVKQAIADRRNLHNFITTCSGKSFENALSSMTSNIDGKEKPLFAKKYIGALAKCFKKFLKSYNVNTIDELVDEIGPDFVDTFLEFYDDYSDKTLEEDEFPGIKTNGAVDEIYNVFKQTLDEFKSSPITVESLAKKIKTVTSVASATKGSKSVESKESRDGSTVSDEEDPDEIVKGMKKKAKKAKAEGAEEKKGSKVPDSKKADGETSPTASVDSTETSDEDEDPSGVKEEGVYVGKDGKGKTSAIKHNEDLDADDEIDDDEPVKPESKDKKYNAGYMVSAVDEYHYVTEEEAKAFPEQLGDKAGQFVTADQANLITLEDGSVVSRYADAYNALNKYGALGDSLKDTLAKVQEKLNDSKEVKVHFVYTGDEYTVYEKNKETGGYKANGTKPLIFTAVEIDGELYITGVAQQAGLSENTSEAKTLMEAITKDAIEKFNEDAQNININGNNVNVGFSSVTSEAGCVANGRLNKTRENTNLASMANESDENASNIPFCFYDRSSNTPIIYGTKDDGSPIQEKDIENYEKHSKIPGQIFILAKNAKGKYTLVATKNRKMKAEDKDSLTEMIKTVMNSEEVNAFVEQYKNATNNEEKAAALKGLNEVLFNAVTDLEEAFNLSNYSFNIDITNDGLATLNIAPLVIDEETGKHKRYEKNGKTGNVVSNKDAKHISMANNDNLAGEIADAFIELGVTASVFTDNSNGLAAEQGDGTMALSNLESNVNPFTGTFKNAGLLVKPMTKDGHVDQKCWEEKGPVQVSQEAKEAEDAKRRKNIEKEKEKSTPEEMTAKFGEPVVIYRSTTEGSKELESGKIWNTFDSVKTSTPYWLQVVKHKGKNGKTYETVVAYYLDRFGNVQKNTNRYDTTRLAIEKMLQNSFEVNADGKAHNTINWSGKGKFLDFVDLYLDNESDNENLSFVHRSTFKNKKTGESETSFNKMKIAVVPEFMAEGIRANMKAEELAKRKKGVLFIDLVDGHILDDVEVNTLTELFGKKKFAGQEIGDNNLEEVETTKSVEELKENLSEFGYTISSKDIYSLAQAKPGKGKALGSKSKMSFSEALGLTAIEDESKPKKERKKGKPTTVADIDTASVNPEEVDTTNDEVVSTGEDLINGLFGEEKSTEEQIKELKAKEKAKKKSATTDTVKEKPDFSEAAMLKTVEEIDKAKVKESTPKDNKEITGTRGKIVRGRKPKNRLITDEEYREIASGSEVWNQEEETKVLNEMLPQLTSTERMMITEGLINVAGDVTAWGFCQDAHITLSDIAAPGTAYHEAFHVVFGYYLSEAERQALFAEARQKYGNKSEDDLEEDLAEGFREYVQAKQKERNSMSGKIARFFKSLWLKITHPTETNTIMNMYNNIYAGKYSVSNLSKADLEDLRTRLTNLLDLDYTEEANQIWSEIKNRFKTIRDAENFMASGKIDNLSSRGENVQKTAQNKAKNGSNSLLEGFSKEELDIMSNTMKAEYRKCK